MTQIITFNGKDTKAFGMGVEITDSKPGFHASHEQMKSLASHILRSNKLFDEAYTELYEARKIMSAICGIKDE